MTLHIELSPTEEAQLTAAARQKGIDPSAYAKELVTDHLPSIPQASEEIGDFGGLSFAEAFHDLIGAVDTGPDDVSENPEKYLKGFGGVARES